LFRSGTHDQKVSVTFADDDDDDDEDDEDDALDADAVAGADDELPWEEQPAATSVASAAAAAIAVTRTRRVPRRGERIAADWPPSMSFMAPPEMRGR
jgi:hypothetical protein